MKTVTKIAILLAVIFGMNFTASAGDFDNKAKVDSIVINFGKGGRMVLMVKDASDLEALKAIDFDKLIAEMSAYIDSAKKSENGVLIVNTERGEFKIYTEDVEEEGDDILVVEINKGIYIGKASGKDKWELKREQRRTQ
ncbi:MAG: hypothetical protein ACI81T_002207, partial [Bacteroidia bacterium]